MPPRAQQLPLTRRVQTDPRETFDYTTPDIYVAASPRDMFVHPGQSQLSQLANALSSIQPGLRAIQQEIDFRNQERFEEGQLARAQGQEAPEDAHWSFIEGYEGMDGRLAASQYRLQGQQLLANARTMDPDQFNQELEALSQSFVPEGASDSYLQNFLEEALPYEEQLKSRYQQIQNQRLQEEVVTKVSVRSSDLIEGNIQSILEENFGVNDLEGLLNNPETYLQLDTEDASALFAPALRKSLTEMQKEAKALGVPKNEISRMWLEKVGTLAWQYGLPELLEFAEQKDQSGIALSDTELGDEVAAYKQRAQSSRNRITQALDAKITQERNHQRELAKNQFAFDLMDVATLDDPVQGVMQAELLLNRLETDYADFDNSWLRTAQNRALQIRDQFLEASQTEEESLWPEESDPNTWNELNKSRVRGELTQDMIQAAFEDRSLTASHLTQANTWLKQQQEAKERERKQAEEEARPPETLSDLDDGTNIKNYWDEIYDFLTLGNLSPFEAALQGIDIEKARAAGLRAEVLLTRRTERWLRDHREDTNYLTSDNWLTDVGKTVLEDFGYSLNELMSGQTRVQLPLVEENQDEPTEEQQGWWGNAVDAVSEKASEGIDWLRDLLGGDEADASTPTPSSSSSIQPSASTPLSAQSRSTASPSSSSQSSPAQAVRNDINTILNNFDASRRAGYGKLDVINLLKDQGLTQQEIDTLMYAYLDQVAQRYVQQGIDEDTFLDDFRTWFVPMDLIRAYDNAQAGFSNQQQQ